MRVLLTAMHPVGGIRTFFRYIYSNPAFENTEIHLIAPDDGLGEFLADYLPASRFVLQPIPPSATALLRVARAAIQLQSFDLIHSHGFTAGALTEFARGFTTTPHLMTAHDVFQRGQFRGVRGQLKRLGMGQLFQRMSGIHTVTEEARGNFLEFFPRVQAERIHGILHGVDTEFFRSGGAQDLRARFGIESSRPLIGFFGRFMAQKGFRDLVEAVRLLLKDDAVNPKPMVVTFGWGGFIREDYEYLHNLGLSEYFVQAPGTDDMAGALKGVDLIAMPSLWEACGLLAMEALAAGKPVVGTDCVGLNEVLRDTPARAVPPRSPIQLAGALREMLQDHCTVQHEFLAFQNTACERFSIERPACELRALYDKLTR